jgi:excisionase family DNA binding protein
MASAVVPEASEKQRAKQALEELAGLSGGKGLVLVHGDEVRAELPESVVEALFEILGHLSRGQRVTITPLNAQLTTGEVAQMLGCSRAHVVKLIDSGRLAASKVGTHRRVLAADLEAFKRRDYEERARALEEYMALSEELFGDDE